MLTASLAPSAPSTVTSTGPRTIRDRHHQGLTIDLERDLLIIEEHLRRGLQASP